jgi:hypothetical protein
VVSVVTTMTFPFPPAVVWRELVVYEELRQPPPLYLRLLLPKPIRTEGGVLAGRGEVKCVYADGHLVKRVTRVEPSALYAFDVVEQTLAVGGGIRLLGGRYSLGALSSGSTEVAAETRYVGGRRPRWFWKPMETMVCGAFHRYILSTMRREIENGSRRCGGQSARTDAA